jgi:hypothetical protein
MSDSEVMMRTKMGVKDDLAQVAHVLCTFVHPCAPLCTSVRGPCADP